MASLELRKETYRLVFLYAGKKHGYSLDTGDKQVAEALRGGAEKVLMGIEQQPRSCKSKMLSFVAILR